MSCGFSEFVGDEYICPTFREPVALGGGLNQFSLSSRRVVVKVSQIVDGPNISLFRKFFRRSFNDE